jgi:hypothetical protein
VYTGSFLVIEFREYATSSSPHKLYKEPSTFTPAAKVRIRNNNRCNIIIARFVGEFDLALPHMVGISKGTSALATNPIHNSQFKNPKIIKYNRGSTTSRLGELYLADCGNEVLWVGMTSGEGSMVYRFIGKGTEVRSYDLRI